MPITRSGLRRPAANAAAGYARISRQVRLPVYAPSVSGTRTSLTGWLARMGFADVGRAERQLAGLDRIAERNQGLSDALTQDSAFRTRLTAVLGVSKALADHLARHPDDCAVLRGPNADGRPDPAQIRKELLESVAADPDNPEPTASLVGGKADPAARLAAAYRRRIL